MSPTIGNDEETSTLSKLEYVYLSGIRYIQESKFHIGVISVTVLLYMCIVNTDKFSLIQFIRYQDQKYTIQIRIKYAKFRTLEPMA